MQCAACSMQYAVCSMQYAVCSIQYAVCSMQYAVGTDVYTAVYSDNLRFTVCYLQCVNLSVQCSQYAVHCLRLATELTTWISGKETVVLLYKVGLTLAPAEVFGLLPSLFWFFGPKQILFFVSRPNLWFGCTEMRRLTIWTAWLV